MLLRVAHTGGQPELIKTHIAAGLRKRILSGELQAGQIISETHWATLLGAAQVSVREALNLLVTEGLVQKQPGRSARVTKLTQRDVVQVYQVRAALEGVAARLIAEQGLDLSELEQAVREMRSAARRGDLKAAIESDLAFHLLLAEKSGNPFLAQHLRQLLLPLFSFTLIRAHGNKGSARAWFEAVDDHLLVLAGIRSKDPIFAEQSVRHVMLNFLSVAKKVWATGEPEEQAANSL